MGCGFCGVFFFGWVLVCFFVEGKYEPSNPFYSGHMICSVISKHCLAGQRTGLLQPPGLLAGSDFTPLGCAPGAPMRTRARRCATEINGNRALLTSSADQGLGNMQRALLALPVPQNIHKTGKGKRLHEHDHSCRLAASVSRSQTIAIKNRSA